jgi:RimJ/RimL family protein N-acetyltransferase
MTENFSLNTERLILRKLVLADVDDMFYLDSNPSVHKYLGNKPISSIEEAREIIAFVIEQYSKFNIGRWAVIEKETKQFVGWAGLKFHHLYEGKYKDSYDLGYRLIPKYWGKGYATEASKAIIQYGLKEMGLNEIYAGVNIHNLSSKAVLNKCGFIQIDTFNWNDIPCEMLLLTKEKWQSKGNDDSSL